MMSSRLPQKGDSGPLLWPYFFIPVTQRGEEAPQVPLEKKSGLYFL